MKYIQAHAYAERPNNFLAGPYIKSTVNVAEPAFEKTAPQKPNKFIKFPRKITRMLEAALFGFCIWQAVAWLVRYLRGIPFPAPADFFFGLLELLRGEPFMDFSIYEHIVASGARWLAGFGSAWLCAVLYAFLAFRCSRFRSLSLASVEFLQLVPGLAWAPVVILLFGLSNSATLAIIFLTTFPVLARAALSGFETTDPDYARIGKSFGYSTMGIWRTVYFPAALPHLLSGTRIALGVSWRVLVAAEMVVGEGTGLGFAIIQSRWTMDYVAAFSCIILIAAIGLGLERLVLMPLETRTILRWNMSHNES